MEAVYASLRRMAYDSESYKWKISGCILIIQRIPSLSTNDFLIDLSELKDKYHEKYGDRGRRGFTEYIHRLGNSKKFLYSKYDFNGLQLKKGTDIIDFIQDLKVLHRHINISHNNYVKFVFKSFNTGLTESTLRRYYFDVLSNNCKYFTEKYQIDRLFVHSDYRDIHN